MNCVWSGAIQACLPRSKNGLGEKFAFQKDEIFLQPVYHSGFSAGYGLGYPYSRHHGYHANNWIGYETGPEYAPVTSIVVRFTRNRVSGWERLR